MSPPSCNYPLALLALIAAISPGAAPPTFASIPAFAPIQDSAADKDADKDKEPEVITITGTRIETPINRVGRSVDIVTAEEIAERQQRFLFETLQNTPGVQVTRSGSFGALTSVSVRGLPGAQTLVVQDGVVLNDPSDFGNGFNFANFDTADIDRIEILRGAQSTLYGSDAIGGVINIVTRDGGSGFGVSGYAESGSFGTLRGSATVRGGSDRFSGRLTLSGTLTNGFSSADNANGNTEADGFDNITISAKGRFQPNDTLRLDAVARYQDSENDFDSFTTEPVDGDEIGRSEELTLAAYATVTVLDGLLENRASATYYRNERLNLTDGEPSLDITGDRLSFEYQARVRPLDGLELIVGVEFDEQSSAVEVGFGGNQVIETTSLFALVQITPQDWLTLNAGVRHDEVTVFGAETSFSTSGAITLPTIKTRLRASYSEGFRAPTAGELGFNPDLFAEVSSGWDIGVSQPFFDGLVDINLTYFDQQIDDLIAFDLALFSFLNVQEFDTSGIEVGVKFNLLDYITVSAAYTYLDAVNVSTTLAAGNQPDHRYTAEVAFRASDRLSLSARILYNGEETGSGAVVLDDFTLVDLRASYRLIDGVTLFGRVENLFDVEYQDILGYGTAPISAFGGVRVKF